MRGSPSGDESSVAARLAQLDERLREFEAAIRAQQQRHERARALELELAALVERGASLVRDLATSRDYVRSTVDQTARDALASSGSRIQEFEQRAAHILDAYSQAVRAAQHAVARAEARIEAFDERVAHELVQAGREIRDAAVLIREYPARENAAASALSRASAGPSRGPGRLIPALLAATLLLAGYAAYAWVARTLRDAAARADAAERQSSETRREANRQIATLERTAQQASSGALSTAAKAERMVGVLAAPDTRRAVLFGRRAAPRAGAQVLWSPSRGVVISGTRFPPLADTAAYQLWVTTMRGAVSLGFVAPDARGGVSGVFDLPSQLPGSIVGFMVTREPAGGSPRPKGTIVLAS